MEAEKMFEGQPEKSLVAAILWAFDVSRKAFVFVFVFSCQSFMQTG